MRDSKLLFHDNLAPAAASATVDLNSSQPGVGTVPFYSATYSGSTVGGDVTVTLTTSDTETGAFAAAAVFTIAQADVPASGNVLISTPVPVTCKRFVKSAIAGLTGGTVTDGIDWGLREGKAATKPYLAPVE